MENVTGQFCERIFQLSKSNFKPELILQAKKCFVDYLGVTIAGAFANRAKIQECIRNGQGDSSLIGFGIKASIDNAVMVNAYNAHILELDDGHRMGMLHLGAVVFSSLLSVAEQKNCTVGELYAGAIVGYETSIRLAKAMQPSHKKKGFHATGTCGTVGSAMGIAAMLNYSKQEMLNTMSAAATSAGGLLEVITGKSEQKAYNVANAANAGVNAALFGKYFQCPEDILGGKRGFLRNFSDVYDEKQLIKDDGDAAIQGIYVKPYAACRHCHAPIEAAISIGKNKLFSITDIEEIIVETYGLAVFGHDHSEIEGINSAKMSIPYGVAIAMLFQRADLEMFTDEMITNENILHLAQKVKVYENDELSRLVPDKRAAILIVRCKSGYEQRAYVEHPKGEPENPLEYKELMEKFYSLLSSADIGRAQAQRIQKMIEENENIEVRKMLNIVNGTE